MTHKEDPQAGSLCPEYDIVKVDFENVHDTMLRLRQQLLAYREANGRLWMSATSLSIDFAQMLDTTDPHPYHQMAATLKQSHSALPQDRERLDTMLNACLIPMKDQLTRFDELKARMIEHDKKKEEVVYYQGKVNDLKRSRETAKKPETATEKEKYERNVKKLLDQETEFQAMDRLLVGDLKAIYTHRVAVLGPIMLAFVVAEKAMMTSYTRAIQEVQLVDMAEANAWLAEHEANIAKGLPGVATVTTTTTTVTEVQSPRTIVTTIKTNEQPDLLNASALTNASTAINEPTLATHYNGSIDTTTAATVASPATPASRFSDFSPEFTNLNSPQSAVQIDSTSIPYTIASSASSTSSSLPSSSSHSNGTSISLPATSSVPSDPLDDRDTPFDSPKKPVGSSSYPTTASVASFPATASAVSVLDELPLENAKVQEGEAVKDVDGVESVDLTSPMGAAVKSHTSAADPLV